VLVFSDWLVQIANLANDVRELNPTKPGETPAVLDLGNP